MLERSWQPTGHQYKVSSAIDKLPDYDSRTGAHFWLVLSCYQILQPELTEDPTHTPMLDIENLVNISPIFCFFCEEVYSKRLSFRRCPGHPDD